jgi:RimJ/RimL family protein N-acetyltransferase
MNPIDLIRLEAELEYGVPIHGDRISITAANTHEVPRVTVAKHANGYVRLFRADLSAGSRKIFGFLQPAELFAAGAIPNPFQTLGVSSSINIVWYVISRIPDPSEFPDVVERSGRFVVEQNGQVAASAWSAQKDDRAAEVEVETAAAFRRRGFGRQVVAAWAHHVRRQGKIALYSHLTTNEASHALAASLGAWKYAETREYF